MVSPAFVNGTPVPRGEFRNHDHDTLSLKRGRDTVENDICDRSEKNRRTDNESFRGDTNAMIAHAMSQIAEALRDKKTDNEGDNSCTNNSTQGRMREIKCSNWGFSAWPTREQVDFSKGGKFLCPSLKEVLFWPDEAIPRSEDVECFPFLIKILQ